MTDNGTYPRLVLAPVTLEQANRYVQENHRHNGAMYAARFAVCLVDPDSGDVHGIAVAGLPNARMSCDGWTLELRRVCTDGSRNACSMLYGACLRAAKALGYRRVQTYTMASEPGSSLRAVGFQPVAETKPDTWARYKQPEHAGRTHADMGWHDDTQAHNWTAKVRWEVLFGEYPAAPTWPASDTGQLALDILGSDIS
jgi:hypothetical protein